MRIAISLNLRAIFLVKSKEETLNSVTQQFFLYSWDINFDYLIIFPSNPSRVMPPGFIVHLRCCRLVAITKLQNHRGWRLIPALENFRDAAMGKTLSYIDLMAIEVVRPNPTRFSG